MPNYEFPESPESAELKLVVEALRAREEFDAESQKIVSDWAERNKWRIDQDPTGRARVEFDIDHADLYFQAGYPSKAINIFYDLSEAASSLDILEINNKLAAFGQRLLAKLQEVLAIKRQDASADPLHLKQDEERIEYVRQLNEYFATYRKQ